MTAANLPKSLALVLVHEGGYVNHPRDPGGATNKGVTQYTYNSYLKAKGRASVSVRGITDAEVADIYKSRYWDAVKGDSLPSGVDYAVFDFGVNSGPSRAITYLQRCINVDDDGQCGPVTIAAANRSSSTAVIAALCDRRLAFLKALGTWSTFGRGWSSRVAGVRKAALAMATGAAPVLPPTMVFPEVAPPPVLAAPKTDDTPTVRPPTWVERFRAISPC